jgi:hypothetical protein
MHSKAREVKRFDHVLIVGTGEVVWERLQPNDAAA